MESEGLVPDIYTDGVKVNAGPFGVTLTLHRSTQESMESEDQTDIGPAVANIRMNAALAEAIAGILMRVVELDRARGRERDDRKNGEKSDDGSGEE